MTTEAAALKPKKPLKWIWLLVLVALVPVVIVVEAALVVPLYDYAMYIAWALAIGLIILGFRLLPLWCAIPYAVVVLIFDAMIFPNIEAMIVTPYVEFTRSEVRKQIEAAKQRDGVYPADVSAIVIQAADTVGADRARIIKRRAYKYDPATGDFSIERAR